MSNVTSMPVPQELISTICPNCGYSLEGLGDDDCCPECGRRQDRSELVLYGSPNKPDAVVDTSQSPKSFRLVLIYVLGLACLYMLIFQRQAAGVLYGLVALAIFFIKHYDLRHPGVVQIRMSSAGVVQFNHSGGATFQRKLIAGYGWMIPLTVLVLAGCFLAMAHWQYAVAITCALALILLPITWRAMQMAWHYFRASRGLSDSALADANMVLCKFTPWTDVRRYAIEPATTGYYRVRVQQITRHHLFDDGRTIANAEVKMNADGAARLHELMGAWIAAARKQRAEAPVAL